MTIRELLVARADLVQQIGFLQYDIGEFREPAQLGFEMLTQMRERLERIDRQLTAGVELPDDPGVLDLVVQAERMLGALAATTSSEELLAAHTVLAGRLVPGARAAEEQRTWPPQPRTFAPGTGNPLPWGYWSAGLTNAELIALHTALGVLTAAADGTDEQTAAVALGRLMTLFHQWYYAPSVEAVDIVLALAPK